MFKWRDLAAEMYVFLFALFSSMSPYMTEKDKAYRLFLSVDRWRTLCGLLDKFREMEKEMPDVKNFHALQELDALVGQIQDELMGKTLEDIAQMDMSEFYTSIAERLRRIADKLEKK